MHAERKTLIERGLLLLLAVLLLWASGVVGWLVREVRDALAG
jgi:hypothetical protein